MADSIGIMDGAYFISKSELLSWINDLLKLNLTKIEQLGTGAVYCQLLDACYPGEVSVHKLAWKAKQEYEFVNNFKVLQSAFGKLKITKYVEVEKLIKGKPLDNIEFGQWFKRYYEIKYGKGTLKDYDPVARRGNVEVDIYAFVDKNKPKLSSAGQEVKK